MGQPGTVGAFRGRHVLAELYGVAPHLLNDETRLRQILPQVLTQAGATVLNIDSHHFAPIGVTVLALLSESHASIHTYPETGRCFVDIFTCGTRADPELAMTLLATAMGCDQDQTRIKTIERGTPTPAAPLPLASLHGVPS